MNALRERAQAMFAVLHATYPDARCGLDFDGPFQLVVATVLSAQSTDKGVNKVTPTLFARCPTPETLAAIDRIELEEIIHSTGAYRNKAASIQGLAEHLIERFTSRVPQTLEELTTLPGVGRKTANVVLGHAFGIPGITADTHVLRLSKRMGWSTSDKPEQVETDLNALFQQTDWTVVSDVTIWHGRRRCHAKKAACGACPVAATCPSFGLFGPTDEAEAAKLVKE
ncbi:MAG: endonuclease III [Propionibacteriaceae bacterium]|nr:endonuclease III [Propionibacteriaceae bacterium]